MPCRLLHNETTYLADWCGSPFMRTNSGNKMTKQILPNTLQPVNGLNDFLFCQPIL